MKALTGSSSPGAIGGGARANGTPLSNTTGLAAPTGVAGSLDSVTNDPSRDFYNSSGATELDGLLNATYYFVVTATKGALESTASSEVAINNCNVTPYLSWNAVSGATGYNVYRGTSSGGETTLIASVTDTHFFNTCPSAPVAGSPPASNTSGVSFTLTPSVKASGVGGGALAAGSYYYKFTVTTASGETLPSSEVSATVGSDGWVQLDLAVQPTTGVNLTDIVLYRGTSAGGENEKIVFSNISAISGGATVTFRFTDAGSLSTTQSPPGSGTTISAPTLNSATPSISGGSLATGTYYYEITATDSSGETTASNEKTAAVTGPTGSVALSWGAVTGATGYKIYRGTSSSQENLLVTTIASGATTTYTDTMATPPIVETGWKYKLPWSARNGNTLAIATFLQLGSPVVIEVTDQSGVPFQQLGETATSDPFYPGDGVHFSPMISLSLWQVPGTAEEIVFTLYTRVPTCQAIFDSDHTAAVVTAGGSNTPPPSLRVSQFTIIAFGGDAIQPPPPNSIISPDYAPGGGFSTIAVGHATMGGNDPQQSGFYLYVDEGNGLNYPSFASRPNAWAAIGM